MLRLLVLVLLVLLIWVFLTALLSRLRIAVSATRPATGRRNPGAAAGRPAERLLRCATCGVRVPESRALPASHRAHAVAHGADGTVFCSEACRRQAMRDSA